jgi:hypothetical protein
MAARLGSLKAALAHLRSNGSRAAVRGGGSGPVPDAEVQAIGPAMPAGEATAAGASADGRAAPRAGRPGAAPLRAPRPDFAAAPGRAGEMLRGIRIPFVPAMFAAVGLMFLVLLLRPLFGSG